MLLDNGLCKTLNVNRCFKIFLLPNLFIYTALLNIRYIGATYVFSFTINTLLFMAMAFLYCFFLKEQNTLTTFLNIKSFTNTYFWWWKNVRSVQLTDMPFIVSRLEQTELKIFHLFYNYFMVWKKGFEYLLIYNKLTYEFERDSISPQNLFLSSFWTSSLFQVCVRPLLLMVRWSVLLGYFLKRAKFIEFLVWWRYPVLLLLFTVFESVSLPRLFVSQIFPGSYVFIIKSFCDQP